MNKRLRWLWEKTGEQRRMKEKKEITKGVDHLVAFAGTLGPKCYTLAEMRGLIRDLFCFLSVCFGGYTSFQPAGVSALEDIMP